MLQVYFISINLHNFDYEYVKFKPGTIIFEFFFSDGRRIWSAVIKKGSNQIFIFFPKLQKIGSADP
jgi:hypothetical protein